jgi:hypothetical protein
MNIEYISEVGDSPWPYIGLLYLQGKNLYFSNDKKIGEILCKEDGFYDFWPESGEGYWSGYVLRAIADLLYDMNEPMEKALNEYFEKENMEDSAG